MTDKIATTQNAPMTPWERFKADRFDERELTRLQGIYRNYANCKFAIKEDKNQTKNILKSLEQLKKERRSIKANLAVATATTHIHESELHMACLAAHVHCQEMIQRSIEEVRQQIAHLWSQNKRIAYERFQTSKTALTDLQHSMNLKRAQRNLEINENRLDVSRKQEYVQVAANTKLRYYINHMLYDRALFNKLWQQMIVQLCFDKKFLIDMVDRAVLAFNQGATLCTELDVLREKSIRDKRAHIVDMRDMIRRLDADRKSHEFLEGKGFDRKLMDLEPREYRRRQEFRNDKMDKIGFYKKIIDKMVQFSNVKDIQGAIDSFIKSDDEYFAHFNYMNSLNYQIEFLNECLNKIYRKIDDQRQANAELAQAQLNALQQRQDDLDATKANSAEVNEHDRNNAQELNHYFETIDELFVTLRCDRTPLLVQLGQQNTVNKRNVWQLLSILESRLNTVLNFVYYDDRKPEPKEVLTVRGVDRVVEPPTQLDDIVLVQQCAECAEGEVNRYDEEIVYPMEMPEIRQKVRAKTEAPEIQYRLHRLSKCRLPRSRALVNKRYL